MQDAPQRALVLARWNSWVHVWLPDSGETRWIELEPESWEPLALEPSRPSAADAPQARRLKSVK